MLFQLDIKLTEEDYSAFNTFHSLESTHGKKIVNRNRSFFVIVMIALAVLLVFVNGWTSFSTTYVILTGLYTTLYILFFKKIVKRNIASQINRMKRTGKLPFDPQATLEFHEDCLVEITPSKRIEQGYDVFERICVTDRYIFLYTSSVQAYILPIFQIRQQLVEKDFMDFLSKKCSNIEHY